MRWVGHRCYLRMEDGHCAALRIERDPPRFVCSIYERRPRICRALERGSPECEGERAEKRGRVLAVVR